MFREVLNFISVLWYWYDRQALRIQGSASAAEHKSVSRRAGDTSIYDASLPGMQITYAFILDVKHTLIKMTLINQIFFMSTFIKHKKPNKNKNKTIPVTIMIRYDTITITITDYSIILCITDY